MKKPKKTTIFSKAETEKQQDQLKKCHSFTDMLCSSFAAIHWQLLCLPMEYHPSYSWRGGGDALT